MLRCGQAPVYTRKRGEQVTTLRMHPSAKSQHVVEIQRGLIGVKPCDSIDENSVLGLYDAGDRSGVTDETTYF